MSPSRDIDFVNVSYPMRSRDLGLCYLMSGCKPSVRLAGGITVGIMGAGGGVVTARDGDLPMGRIGLF